MIDGPDTDWARYFQGRKVEYCVPWPGGMILWWYDLGGGDLGGDDPVILVRW